MEESCSGLNDVVEPMDVWEQRMCSLCPTFCFWVTIKRFLLLVCRFVRGQRQANWNLTLQAIFGLTSWFFVCGRWNYSRWSLVFLRDMVQLPSTHPDVHEAFQNGLFVVQRSNKKFATMALDQSQEHCVKYLKDGSGTKGLYGQQSEQEMIELSRPEVMRLLDEFESSISNNTNERKTSR